MRLTTDVAVIGGGVVGVAVAAHLASRGQRVVLVERHARLGTETSARNSGVIHAGLYYAEGSLKSRTCVRGRELLHAYCEARSIGHARTGKLVIATSESEIEALHALRMRAEANGVQQLTFWSSDTLEAREPNLRGVLAMHVAESGIVDAHALVESLARDAREHDATIAVATALIEARPANDGYVLTLGTGDTVAELFASQVVNSAGLGAEGVSALFGIDVDSERLRLHTCKGDYFVLGPRAPRPNHALVYPLPSSAGLGIHLTTDLAGIVRAGPDTEWIDAPRYDVDETKAGLFAAALRRYLPGIRDEDLRPDYAGVRPKLGGPSELGRDFVIEECGRFGLRGYVHLVGIESPGLTAAMAIAEEVARCLGTVP